MDLQDNLIECNSNKRKGGWKSVVGSAVLHGVIIAFVLFMSASSTKVVDAEQQPIRAYITQGAAPPPPPPPPPPPAAKSAGGGSPKPATPKQVTQIQLPKPVMKISQLTPPTEIPKEIPTPQPVQPVQLKLEDASSSLPQPMISSSGSGGDGSDPTSNNPAGVPGGVPGGVAGGVAGGELGGVVGGQIGGVAGGVVGGQVGGQLGGTGSGTQGTGTGDKNAPLRVGGDVKAPTIVSKFEPKYTEPARHARITGVVVVEAIINKQGEVEDVKVLKGLPMGLSEEATEAVRRWRFRPGTLNGEPVDVIFDLTVNFKMD